ncbi:MAG: hypothetical protein AAGI37_19150 [Planctomycetota bacterium]
MAKELKIIADLDDFMPALTQRIEKFPRHHLHSLGASVEQRLQTILALLLKARYTRDRSAFLSDANVEIEVLRCRYDVV